MAENDQCHVIYSKGVRPAIKTLLRFRFSYFLFALNHLYKK